MKHLFFLLPFLASLSVSAQIPDTVYSKQIISEVSLNGDPVEGATIAYTLIDTVNNNQELIREAITDANGRDIVDSLPVLKHYTGIEPNPYTKADNGIVVSNNGTGAVHSFSFKSDEKIGKEAYIVNLSGQKIANIPITYNPATETYDAVWKGQGVDEGIYLFYTPTTNGPIASKIKHLKNQPGIIPACRRGRDYATPTPKDSKKSTEAEKDDPLAVSKYQINITGENLEDFVDYVWITEGQFSDLAFHVNGAQYEDADVWGQIYFVENGQSPSNVYVEYKRYIDPSIKFNTTSPNGVYNIQVPVVYESDNPGETKYIVTISPNGGDDFITLVDTLLVTSGVNGFVHYVSQQSQEQTQDIVGIIRNVYSRSPESGVTIRVLNRITGDLIEEDVTTSNGEYAFNDIPAGTKVEFELGKPGELWMINNNYDVPEQISDTIITFNRYFYPKTVEVPQVGSNTTITGDGEEIAEITGTDKVNFEEILRDTDYMWANGTDADYTGARTWIADNFYEGDSPITTASTQRNITNDMIGNYEPYTNYYAGQLGWNVNFGSGNLTTPITVPTDYGVTAIMGGEIMTTGAGSNPFAPVIKELQGRRLVLGSVASRPSMMNTTATMPDEKDRAYVHLILLNQKGRFSYDEETYSLETITSNEPDANAAHTNKGNQPHCKLYFNTAKYKEQLSHTLHN